LRAFEGFERTEHAAREEAARALLGLGAVDRVGRDVQAVVGEARQRQARLGVLGWGWGWGVRRAACGARGVLGACCFCSRLRTA
jgi:hypothetical protein